MKAYTATDWLIYSGYRILDDPSGFAESSNWDHRSNIDSITLPTTYCDGGDAAIWGRKFPCVYYHTFFDNGSDALLCTPTSIERLFKRGVEDALEMLRRNGNVSQADNTSTSPDVKKIMVIAPGEDLDSRYEEHYGKKKLGFLQRGNFVDVKNRTFCQIKDV